VILSVNALSTRKPNKMIPCIVKPNIMILIGNTNIIMIPSIMIPNIMIPSITILKVNTRSIMILSIMMQSMTKLSIRYSAYYNSRYCHSA
jgi:hypothetical protein